MAYTAIENMREINEARFGSDVGPMQPPLYTNRRRRNDLKSAALRFLHNQNRRLSGPEPESRSNPLQHADGS